MPSSKTPKRGRARPLSPDERRAEIIAAVVPLLREHGVNVTTRQIAEAASVAEGTLFRVFDDKDELIRAAVDHALDPGESARRVEQIDPRLPLDERVVAAVEILHERLTSTIELATAVGPHMFRRTGDKALHERHRRGFASLDAIFEPSAGDLRVEPSRAAQLLEMLTFSNAHPRLNRGAPMPPETVASLVLDGIRRRDCEQEK